MPLASSRGALPGILERHARLRRDRVHRAAAHRSRFTRDGRPTSCWPCSPTNRRLRATRLSGLTGARTGRLKGERGCEPLISGDFDEFWQTAVHDGVMAESNKDFQHEVGRAKERLGGAPQAGEAANAPDSGTGKRQLRDRLPARPDDLRRPLRQQRLAAGAAQADHEAHLGQRRPHEPGNRARAWALGWAATRTAASTAAITCRWSSCKLGRVGPGRAAPGLDHARPRRRLDHRLPGLRPGIRGPGRRHGRRTRSASTPTRCAPPTIPGSLPA